MSLTRQALFQRDGMEIRAVTCRPHRPEPGGMEHGERATLVLTTAGLFRLHLGRNRSFVVDPAQALFLPPGQPHRYSHPVPGGDACLAIELGAEALAGLLESFDPAAADRGGAPYDAHRVALPADALMARTLLGHRLQAGVASELEVDETIVELVAGWVGARGHRRAPVAVREATLRAHRERVEAVQVRLAGDPGRAWRLDELARHAATAPCHLTTVFRCIVGVPIHRYLVRLRLARALDEVVGTGRSFTEIGADLGFATPSHFAASFRRAFGRSPTAARRDGGVGAEAG